ncbi:MAG: 10kDa chaperonin [Podoviridae sp. ctrTa16]|nr:MAG: 10kDa chaperonin [Podoviridae sp. ctrTa16]
MKSPFYFIAKPVNGRRYDNVKDVGGVELIVSTSEEDHKFSNRRAEVVELPLGYTGEIQPGDVLLVHHNVFKFYNDIRGNRKSGKSFFREDLFFIEPDQFFMYNRGGKWKAYDKYCFVKPIPAEESYIKKPFSEEPLMGEIVYPNEYLLSKGVTSGSRVCFTPDSEYEFIIDGEKMFRMFDHQITILL